MPHGHTFYRHASRFLHSNASFSKLLLACTVSSGSLAAYSYTQPSQTAYADAGQSKKKKKVVVLGTGWAATSFLKNLKSNSYEIHVVSPRNYFAFTPLLPSVTNGTVEARSVVEPIRSVVKKSGLEIHFKEAECYRIEADKKKIVCRSSQALGGKEEFTEDYDLLIIAVGAQNSTFNTPGVLEHAHFLKEVEDAMKIRNTVMDCFERACLPNVSEEEKRRILHFVVVGGGPVGVEYAAELHDFVVEDVARLYPSCKMLQSDGGV